MRMIFRFYLLCLGLVLTASTGLAQTEAPVPKHLLLAEELVRNLKDASENAYGGGKRHIDWDTRPCAARTVCSSALVEKSDVLALPRRWPM